MSGMNIEVGGGMSGLFGGVRAKSQASYGASESYGAGVTSGAFGDSLTGVTSDARLSPGTDVGLFFYIGVGAIVALVWLRSTLPN